jgi:hypothetical protein
MLLQPVPHHNFVEILRARQNSFTGPLPSELFSLAGLREIGFDYNYLTGSIPENVGQAKALGEILTFSFSLPIFLDLSFTSI